LIITHNAAVVVVWVFLVFILETDVGGVCVGIYYSKENPVLPDSVTMVTQGSRGYAFYIKCR